MSINSSQAACTLFRAISNYHTPCNVIWNKNFAKGILKIKNLLDLTTPVKNPHLNVLTGNPISICNNYCWIWGLYPLIRKCCCSLLELQQIGMSHIQVRSYIHASWNKPPLARGSYFIKAPHFCIAVSFSGMYYIRLPFSFGLKKSCKIRKKLE